MENFKQEEPYLSEEKMKELRKQALIRGISQDITELIQHKKADEVIEKIIGKSFVEKLSQEQEGVLQEKIREALKESSDSEIERIIMRIETYKKLNQD